MTPAAKERRGKVSRSTNETTVSSLDVYYGFGLTFGVLGIDAVFNNDFLYDWGYIGSGRTNSSPVSRVSVQYNWR